MQLCIKDVVALMVLFYTRMMHLSTTFLQLGKKILANLYKKVLETVDMLQFLIYNSCK